MTPCTCRDYEYTGMCQHTRASTVAGVKEAIVREFEDKFGGMILTQSKREKQDKDNAWLASALDRLEAAVRADEREKGRASMWEDLKRLILPKAEKFIKKVESGRARSKETYADMKEIAAMFSGGETAIRATTPSNYAHLSHSHCWDQKQPPACGIPLKKHTQCCLCDLPLPTDSK